MYTRDVAMTPDGSELFFGVLLGSIAAIVETHRGADGIWSEPEVASFSRDSRFFNLEPHITLDGTLYFTRGINGGEESYVYRSRLVDGSYQDPERLGPGVNSTSYQFNAFIALDESYLILGTGDRDDTLGGTDYYVTFRNEDDEWSGPINLGAPVNTPFAGEFSPYVSPDGRFLFFMSIRPFAIENLPDSLTWDYLSRFRQLPETGNAGIYWVAASFIENLRPEGF
jgi:hypothetical protein